MAVTLDQIMTLLASAGFPTAVRIRENEAALGFATQNYRNREGENKLLLILSLAEEGEFFRIYAPNAFELKGEHIEAFLKACMVIQWKTKLLQFEYDEADGEVRPIIELPLEDAQPTARQLRRCVLSIATILDEFYPLLKRALDDGLLGFDFGFKFEQESRRTSMIWMLKDLEQKLRQARRSGDETVAGDLDGKIQLMKELLEES